jgi:hypothetical protein
MSIQETPLAAVKRLYGSKDKLVGSIVGVLRAGDEDEGDLKQRLLSASNQKLLRLADVAKTVSDKYGSKEKLAETLAATVGKAKDSDYITKLKSLSAPRLLDMMTAASKKAPK